MNSEKKRNHYCVSVFGWLSFCSVLGQSSDREGNSVIGRVLGRREGEDARVVALLIVNTETRFSLGLSSPNFV